MSERLWMFWVAPLIGGALGGGLYRAYLANSLTGISAHPERSEPRPAVTPNKWLRLLKVSPPDGGDTKPRKSLPGRKQRPSTQLSEGKGTQNAVPCPSRSPIPAQTQDGVAASCRILT